LGILRDTNEQRLLENLRLEQTIVNYWMDGAKVPYLGNEFINFPKTTLAYNAPSLLSLMKAHQGKSDLSFFQEKEHVNIQSVRVLRGVIQMVLRLGVLETTNIPINFKKQNNVWIQLKLEDILVLNPAHEKAINQLITNKIAQLKQVDIECSESNQWFQKLKDIFHYSEMGLRFYLQKTKTYSLHNDASILLTWAELQPYLK
jgi:hypothetical protein